MRRHSKSHRQGTRWCCRWQVRETGECLKQIIRNSSHSLHSHVHSQRSLASFLNGTFCRSSLNSAMICYAMLCRAMLCYALLCHAMLCYALCILFPSHSDSCPVWSDPSTLSRLFYCRGLIRSCVQLFENMGMGSLSVYTIDFEADFLSSTR